jgi:hypothetical protein
MGNVFFLEEECGEGKRHNQIIERGERIVNEQQY